jgi:hypothetical protein
VVRDVVAARRAAGAVNAIRIVCVDGPLAGVQTSVPNDDVVVLYDATGAEVLYRVDGPLGAFPGDLYAARVVTTAGPEALCE